MNNYKLKKQEFLIGNDLNVALVRLNQNEGVIKINRGKEVSSFVLVLEIKELREFVKLLNNSPFIFSDENKLNLK
jgi:hypothetical protein